MEQSGNIDFVPTLFPVLPRFVPTLFVFLPHFGAPILASLWGSCSHFVPLCSHSCPALGFLVSLFPAFFFILVHFAVLVPTLFPFLPHFGVLVPTLCSHFAPTLFPFLPCFGVLAPTLFPLCSHSCITLEFLLSLFAKFFPFLPHFGVLVPTLFLLCSHSCPA